MFLPSRTLIALLTAPFVLPQLVPAEEHPRQQPVHRYGEGHRDAEFRVAIIGAGIAGASAAYHLRGKSISGAFQSSPLAITIYESSNEVGGHVKTTSPPGYGGQPSNPLELGASFFFEDDWCLVEAAQATQTALAQNRYHRKTNDARWILSGGQFLQDRFCEGIDIRPRFWRWHEVKKAMDRALDRLGFELKHQFLPWQIRRRLKAHQERFQHFGRNETFNNVLQELEKCGLQGDVTSSTASRFLESLGMTWDLQRTYLEPCIKEAFGLTLDEALGLHAVLSPGAIRSNFSITAIDGNQRFIERLIGKSKAVVQLSSRVVRVEAGIERRHALTVTSNAAGGEEERLEYDAVIATGNALISLQSPRSRVSQVQQVTTYKTHFSTTSSLEPSAIGAKAANVPGSVLFTTKTASGPADSYESQFALTSLTTWPEFYIDRTGCQFDDECDQWTNVYIAESSSPLSEESLYQLTSRHDYITWTNSHSWHRDLPVVNSSEPSLGEIQVGHFLFNAGNTVLDTMEMSCRMGRNIALKIFEQPSGAMQDLGEDSPWTEADLLDNIQALSH